MYKRILNLTCYLTPQSDRRVNGIGACILCTEYTYRVSRLGYMD